MGQQEHLQKEQERLCRELAAALNEISRGLMRDYLPSLLTRYGYLSRLLHDDEEFLRVYQLPARLRARLRRNHFEAFRAGLHAFEFEIDTVERKMLAKMAASGISFEEICRTRIAINWQIAKLRTAGWLYLIGAPNAERVSVAAVDGLKNIIGDRAAFSFA